MIISKGIGIDLGTTNSAVAILNASDTGIHIAEDEEGSPTTPSAVGVEPKTGAVVVGREARKRRGTTPEPILSIKRSMGFSKEVRLGNRKVTPPQVSAMILREMKAQIERHLGRAHPDLRFEVKRSVITVPAYFGLGQMEDTRAAGLEAGLDVLELLAEPTAAATYYAWKQGIEDANFMVYDLGGGTFDVSVIRRVAGEYDVAGIAGNIHLGGDNFDRKLAERILEHLVKQGYDLHFDRQNRLEDRLNFEKLVMHAERSKIDLSDGNEVDLMVPDVFTDAQGQGVNLKMKVSREILEGLVADDVNETIDLCRTALARAKEKRGLDLQQIDHILLVGGSSKIPLVARRVEEEFCSGKGGRPRAKCNRVLLDEPDTCVAFGAALRASTFGTELTDTAGRVRVFFPRPGATNAARYSLTGKVTALDATIDLASAGGELQNRITGQSEDNELSPEGEFAFHDIALTENFTNNLTLRVVTVTGIELATISRDVEHRQDYKTIGGTLSKQAVLSRPIKLDVLRGNRIHKKTLVARGKELPCEEKFRLVTVDEGKTIRFPIYDEHLLLKEVRVDLDAAPEAGTPIDFTIACDEKFFLTVRGEIEGKPFAAFIEPPPPQRDPTRADWEKLKREFDEAVESLPQGDQMLMTAQRMRLDRAVDDGFRSSDGPQLMSKMGEYRDVVEEMKVKASETLEPPLEEVEELARASIKLADLAAQKLPEFNREESRQNVQSQLARARAAYSSKEQAAYSDCYDRLIHIYFWLKAQLKPAAEETSAADPVSEAMDSIGRLRKEAERLAQLSKGREQLLARISEESRKLDGLNRKVASAPLEVKQQAAIIQAELAKVEQLLKIPEAGGGLPAERDPAP